MNPKPRRHHVQILRDMIWLNMALNRPATNGPRMLWRGNLPTPSIKIDVYEGRSWSTLIRRSRLWCTEHMLPFLICIICRKDKPHILHLHTFVFTDLVKIMHSLREWLWTDIQRWFRFIFYIILLFHKCFFLEVTWRQLQQHVDAIFSCCLITAILWCSTCCASALH